MKKTYTLTIEYDTETEIIEYISQEIIEEDSDESYYGTVILDDYFDEEGLELIRGSFIVGES